MYLYAVAGVSQIGLHRENKGQIQRNQQFIFLLYFTHVKRPKCRCLCINSVIIVSRQNWAGEGKEGQLGNGQCHHRSARSFTFNLLNFYYFLAFTPFTFSPKGVCPIRLSFRRTENQIPQSRTSSDSERDCRPATEPHFLPSLSPLGPIKRPLLGRRSKIVHLI